ncbi:MAG: hypothetical protein QOH87_1953 [Trebonia sp.]|nr:hypothetical protein [Trebonia sp.]
MDDDLRDLLAAWLGGDLDAERAAALQRRVRDDAAFRRAFVAEAQMLSMLKVVQSAEPRWLLLEDELGWGTTASSDEPLEERVLRAIEGPPRSRRAAWPWALVAVALAAVAVISWRPPRPTDPPPAGPVAEPSATVALLVKADGVEWEPAGGQRPAEGEQIRAGPLRLRAGQVTINFVNGVVLSLQGPAELDIASADRVFCRRGKLRTRVPPGAEGFTVLAPGSAVVDMGTEFALNVGDDGKAEVMVFEGRASVSVLNAAGDTVSSEECLGRSAVEVDPGASRIRDGVADAARFVPAVRLVPPDLALDPAYPALVRESQPWGYWRFGARAGGAVANEMANRPSLQVVGGVRLAGGEDAGVAVFEAGWPIQYLVTDGTWAPPRATGYAIELWVLSEGFNHSSLVAAIPVGAGPYTGHVALLEFTGRRRALVHEECAIRFLDRWPVGITGGSNVFSRAMYVPNRWHHIVGQLARGDVELYVDGHLVGSEPSRSAAATTACHLLLGRMKPQPDRDPQQIRGLVGRMAELAVYDQPLTADQIRRHAECRARGSVPPR